MLWLKKMEIDPCNTQYIETVGAFTRIRL